MKRIVQSMFVNILISWLLLMESSHCKTSNRDVPNHDVYSSDYYKRLGVSRKASQKDIKSAFRKLGFKYHPDKCKESDCEEKFQKISEAYTVLSDADKRTQYDNFGESGPSGSGFGFNPGSFNFDFDDLFGNFAGFGDDDGGSFGQHFKVFSNFPDFSNFGSGFGRRQSNHEYGGSNSYFGNHYGASQRASHSTGRSCRTVTQRVGNTITTYTTCT